MTLISCHGAMIILQFLRLSLLMTICLGRPTLILQWASLRHAPLLQPKIKKILYKHQLQSLVETSAERWTYAIFWQVTDSNDGEQVLAWGDGFFNPKEENSPKVPLNEANQELRQKVLYELQAIIIKQSIEDASMFDSLEVEVTDTEWFFLVSMMCNFPLGNGTPRTTFINSQHAWLKGVDQLKGGDCARAELAQRFGIRTIVCVSTQNGVVELGSMHVIDKKLGFLNTIKQSFDPLFSSMCRPYLSSAADQSMGIINMSYTNISRNELSMGNSGQSQSKARTVPTAMMQDSQSAAIGKQAGQGMNDGMNGDLWQALLPPLDMMSTVARLMLALEELHLQVHHANVGVVNDMLSQRIIVIMKGANYMTEEQLRDALSVRAAECNCC